MRVSDIIQAMEMHNLSYIVENVEASLNNLALNMSNETVIGNVSTMVSYVHIHIGWEFLVLPFFVELAAAVLLVATALSSKPRGLRLWKTSALALFYHGLEELTLGEGMEGLR